MDNNMDNNMDNKKEEYLKKTLKYDFEYLMNPGQYSKYLETNEKKKKI